MTEQAQLALINALPAIIAAVVAGIVYIIVQLRHITKLTNSALSAQTQARAEAEKQVADLTKEAARGAAEQVMALQIALARAEVPPPQPDTPQKVSVVNPPSDPIPVVPQEKDK